MSTVKIIYDPTPPRQDMNETDLSVDESVTDPTRCDMKVSVTDIYKCDRTWM